MTEDDPPDLDSIRRHFELDEVETIKAGVRAHKIRHALDDGLARGWLSQRQYDAGERFRDVCESCVPYTSTNYDGVHVASGGSGRTPPLTAIDAWSEWAKVREIIGVTGLAVLVEFCADGILHGHNRDKRNRQQGRVAMALDMLADMWGL